MSQWEFWLGWNSVILLRFNHNSNPFAVGCLKKGNTTSISLVSLALSSISARSSSGNRSIYKPIYKSIYKGLTLRVCMRDGGSIWCSPVTMMLLENNNENWNRYWVLVILFWTGFRWLTESHPNHRWNEKQRIRGNWPQGPRNWYEEIDHYWIICLLIIMHTVPNYHLQLESFKI